MDDLASVDEDIDLLDTVDGLETHLLQDTSELLVVYALRVNIR